MYAEERRRQIASLTAVEGRVTSLSSQNASKLRPRPFAATLRCLTVRVSSIACMAAQ